jgi:hypothetical protein
MGNLQEGVKEPSYQHRLTKHTLSDTGLETTLGNYIHSTFQERLQVILEPTQVKKGSARFEFDKQVDIALFVRFAACDGAEDAHIPRAVLRADLQSLIPLGSQKRLKRHTTP